MPLSYRPSQTFQAQGLEELITLQKYDSPPKALKKDVIPAKAGI